MKRILGITALTGIAVVVMCLAAYAGTYTVTQLTDDNYYKSQPQINDSGQVLWTASTKLWEDGQFIGNKIDIFLYNGTAITQLTDFPHDYGIRNLQINDSGQVLWTHHTGSVMEDGQYIGYKQDIFLYNGTAITQLTDNPVNKYGVDSPQLNNSGQVAWSHHTGSVFDEDGQLIGNKRDIFLYNGTAITQLTDDPIMPFVHEFKLNNSGQVVWTAAAGWIWEDGQYVGHKEDIFLYNGTAVTQLSDNPINYHLGYGYFQINDSGQVAWTVRSGSLYVDGELIGYKYDIYLYNGTAVTQLTDNPNGYGVGEPQLNDSGQVAWSTCTGSIIEDGQYIGHKEDIFLYDGTAVTQLTDNPLNYLAWDTRINDSGQVVWEGRTPNIWEDGQPLGFKYDIYLYNGTASTQLTDNPIRYFVENPRISNSGQVLWECDEEICLYDGTAVIQLSDDTYKFNFGRNPQLNDSGQVVWKCGVQICLAEPDTDRDGDGIHNDVDTEPNVHSDDFSDGVTYGAILTRGDQMLSITDLPGPLGVNVAADPSGGTTPATISACASADIYDVNPGDSFDITCGSVTIDMKSGAVAVVFTDDGGSQASTVLNQGNGLTFDPSAVTFTAPATNSETSVVTVGDTAVSVFPGETCQAVQIDIKPGSYPNSINPRSRGVVPVAVLTTPQFDASTVDPATVTLAGAAVSTAGKSGRYQASLEDVDSDGDLDLVLKIVNELDLQEGGAMATLEGLTYGGVRIEGQDSVRVVP